MSNHKGMDLVTKAMHTNGPAFREMAELLYGDAAWEVIKAFGSQPDPAKRNRTQARVGLATNAVGIGAGTAALGSALKSPNLPKPKGLKPITNALKPLKTAAKPITQAATRVRTLKPVAGATKWAGQHKGAVAVGAVGLQTANLAGDAIANRVLARNAKKGTTIGKREDFTLRWEISKRDDEKRQVFGWASVVEMNGKPVVDLQGDYIPVEVIEKAAYTYVHKSRQGGNQHQRFGDRPLHVSDMIESVVFTSDKKKEMGLPDSFPTGWWVGYQINDEKTWQDIKSGKLKDFSIHGSGVRKEIEIDA